MKYKTNQVRNTKLKKKKKKTNNAYLMSQNHHQILETIGCQWRERESERERDRERWYRKKNHYKVIKSR